MQCRGIICITSSFKIDPVIRRYRNSGKPQRRGWIPKRSPELSEGFPWKSNSFWENNGGWDPHTPDYDICRRPRQGAPAADQRLIFLNNTQPARPFPGGALTRGGLVKIMMSFPIFIVPVRTPPVHTRSYRAVFWLVQNNLSWVKIAGAGGLTPPEWHPAAAPIRFIFKNEHPVRTICLSQWSTFQPPCPEGTWWGSPRWSLMHGDVRFRCDSGSHMNRENATCLNNFPAAGSPP